VVWDPNSLDVVASLPSFRAERGISLSVRVKDASVVRNEI